MRESLLGWIRKKPPTFMVSLSSSCMTHRHFSAKSDLTEHLQQAVSALMFDSSCFRFPSREHGSLSTDPPLKLNLKAFCKYYATLPSCRRETVCCSFWLWNEPVLCDYLSVWLWEVTWTSSDCALFGFSVEVLTLFTGFLKCCCNCWFVLIFLFM